MRRLTLTISIFGLLFAACGRDDRGSNQQTTPDVGASDVVEDGSDATQDAGTDSGRDPGSADTGRDPVSDPEPTDIGRRDVADVRWDPDVEEDVGPPAPDDLACNWEARVEACDHPLLNMTMMPDDPAEFLFYVNRWNSIPAEYPVGETSTWTPCDGGDPGVEHDLVCVPPQYRTADRRSLREVAWRSPAPDSITETYDGRPVGYDGEIGYLPMFLAAEEAGFELFVLSGYRSYATQDALHESYVQREMNRGYTEEEARVIVSTFSAWAGHSEHQLGTTADLSFRQDNGQIYPGLGQSMGDSRAFQWVYENAHRFGIVLTYGECKVETTQYVYEPWHFRFVGVEAADAMQSCDLNTEEFFAARYGADIPLPEYAGESTIEIDSAFVDEHVTLPPGAWMLPGETTEKVWLVENDGSTNWWNFTLEQIEGHEFGVDPVLIPCVVAGDRVQLSVSITAPNVEGTYEGTWSIVNDDGVPFADELRLRIIVSETEPESDPYRYVMIRDLSDATGGGDPGADIDAVVYERDGGLSYAGVVSEYLADPSMVNNNDPNDALGAPDAFYDYPDTNVCGVSTGFVSLGGAGYLVLEMDEEILQGDRIEVLEVGGCDFGSGTAIPDLIEVLVSVDDDPAGEWIEVGSGTGPSIKLTIPELPPLRR